MFRTKFYPAEFRNIVEPRNVSTYHPRGPLAETRKGLSGRSRPSAICPC